MFDLLRRYGRDPTVVRRTANGEAPYRWNLEAMRTGTPALVFTCSLSDWFIETADPWRDDAWRLVRDCQHLRFQILTKRPNNILDRLPADWGQGYPNVWLGVSIENNDYVWRADMLREIPACIRFISAEPLLGPLPDLNLAGIHWLIVGGESGPDHRYMDHAWARDLRDRAKAAGLAFFFKQSSAARSEVGDLLQGREWKELPAGFAADAAVIAPDAAPKAGRTPLTVIDPGELPACELAEMPHEATTADKRPKKAGAGRSRRARGRTQRRSKHDTDSEE